MAAVGSLGLDQGGFVLLPCGLDHRKNGDLVLDAWKEIEHAAPGLKLIVTSNASDPAYLERARGVGRSIVMPGHVDDELMRALYHAAAVVWFPSRYEGFGLPVLEAMACGAPVVTSKLRRCRKWLATPRCAFGRRARGHIEAIRSIARAADCPRGIGRAGRNGRASSRGRGRRAS